MSQSQKPPFKVKLIKNEKKNLFFPRNLFFKDHLVAKQIVFIHSWDFNTVELNIFFHIFV